MRTVVACYEWGAYLGDEGLQKGIRAKVSSFTRGGAQLDMSKGKICGQYVNSRARQARGASRAAIDEAIMLDPQG